MRFLTPKEALPHQSILNHCTKMLNRILFRFGKTDDPIRSACAINGGLSRSSYIFDKDLPGRIALLNEEYRRCDNIAGAEPYPDLRSSGNNLKSIVKNVSSKPRPIAKAKEVGDR